MRKIFLLAVVGLLFSCYALQAQSKKNPWTPLDSLHEYCYLCHNEQHLIRDPYEHTKKKEWRFVLSSGVVLATGIIMGYTDKTKPYTEAELAGLDKNKINSIDRSAINNWSPATSTASDAMLVGISLIPIMFFSENHTKKDIKSLIVLSLETFAFNYGLTNIVKTTVNRPRPYVYNTSLPPSTRTDAESRLSFYSGHTSQTAAATFLFAKVMSDYHPNMRLGLKTGIWIFAATIPALEAYFRVKGGKHYPTDVMTGYALGAFSGWIIPELHRGFHFKKAKKSNFNVGFVPIGNGMQMVMGLSF